MATNTIFRKVLKRPDIKRTLLTQPVGTSVYRRGDMGSDSGLYQCIRRLNAEQADKRFVVDTQGIYINVTRKF